MTHRTSYSTKLLIFGQWKEWRKARTLSLSLREREREFWISICMAFQNNVMYEVRPKWNNTE